jgi:TetR/AcrR family transcriptional repressor of nem operon
MARKKVDRESIIKEALHLFRDHGYHATSMSDIGVACGLLKGSIYHYFPSKEELMKEVIRYLHEYYRHNAFRPAMDKRVDARTKLRRLKDFYIQLFTGQDGGCLMANIAMETHNVIPEFSGLISEFFTEWMNSMEHIYQEDLSKEDAAMLARETVGAVEGATMLMRVFNDPKYLNQSLDAIEEKFDRLSGSNNQLRKVGPTS